MSLLFHDNKQIQLLSKARNVILEAVFTNQMLPPTRIKKGNISLMEFDQDNKSNSNLMQANHVPGTL